MQFCLGSDLSTPTRYSQVLSVAAVSFRKKHHPDLMPKKLNIVLLNDIAVLKHELYSLAGLATPPALPRLESYTQGLRT